MFWTRHRSNIALALWVLVVALFTPSVFYLYSLEPPESDFPLCYPEYNPVYYNEETAEEEAELADAQFRINLAGATDPESQVMNLLVSNNGRISADSIPSLATLSEQFPDSGLVAAEYLIACSKDISHTACSPGTFENVVQSHADNGAIWGSLALLNIEREDIEGAVTALQQGAQAFGFDDYYSTQLRVLDAAAPDNDPLAVGSVFRFFRYADPTIGVSSAQVLTQFCLDNSADDTAVAEACAAYGERVADGSGNLLGKGLGIATQEVVFNATGDTEQSARVQAETEAQRNYRNQFRGNFVGLMTYDQSLAVFWRDSLIEYGEVETIERLYREVMSRSADPDYQPCDPSRLRFAFPYFYMGDERVSW